MHAIHKRRTAAVQLLIERGAQPNRGTPDGYTPLLMAAAEGAASITKLLLAYGANSRARTWFGATPLTLAVSAGALSFDRLPLAGGCYSATVRVLLAHDPTLRLPPKPAGRLALFWARFHGCAEVLDIVQIEPD